MRPWRKWAQDFASTRVQITYGVWAVWCGLIVATILVTWRGVQVIRTAQDAATILNAVATVLGAMTGAFLGVVGAWFAGRWLNFNYQSKGDGDAGEQNRPSQ